MEEEAEEGEEADALLRFKSSEGPSVAGETCAPGPSSGGGSAYLFLALALAGVQGAAAAREPRGRMAGREVEWRCGRQNGGEVGIMAGRAEGTLAGREREGGGERGGEGGRGEKRRTFWDALGGGGELAYTDAKKPCYASTHTGVGAYGTMLCSATRSIGVGAYGLLERERLVLLQIDLVAHAISVLHSAHRVRSTCAISVLHSAHRVRSQYTALRTPSAWAGTLLLT
eukprot:2721435-Rhodomonas_salina.1